MIPYIPEPILHAGPLHISAFTAAGVAAVLVSGWTILKRSSRKQIPADDMFRMWFWMVLCAGGGALAHGWILHGRLGFTTLGAACGGILAAVVWSMYHRLSRYEFLRRVDVMAYTFPLAWMIARFGCALAHDHRGVASQSWIAVAFPNGPRLDLGLLEFLFLAALVVAFRILDRGPRPVGFYFVALGLAYSACRLWLDTLRVDPSYVDAAFGFALVAAGVILIRQQRLAAGPNRQVGSTPSAAPLRG
jgi:phosphatidylglycerol:prolipoprotein diacylglycerol transferase